MLKKYLLLPLMLSFSFGSAQAADSCDADGVWLQVLGSGGPELDDGRASSGYVVWNQGKAKFLVDIGGGSMFQFEQSGASLNDLDAIMLSHMHVDHSNDLPALIKASFFSDRDRDLYLYGPTGNNFMPSATNFVQDLFDNDGAFEYLSSYVNGNDVYSLLPSNVNAKGKTEKVALKGSDYRLTAAPVNHGSIPALAWRIDVAGKSIVFSGDMSNRKGTLATLAKDADLLVAHNAVPEGARGIARNLHMTPSVIGQIAAKADVKQLVLSHRMNRTLGQEDITTTQIRKKYSGPMKFADDLQCFKL